MKSEDFHWENFHCVSDTISKERCSDIIIAHHPYNRRMNEEWEFRRLWKGILGKRNFPGKKLGESWGESRILQILQMRINAAKAKSFPGREGPCRAHSYLKWPQQYLNSVNDDIRAVSKRLDGEKFWRRCEEKGHCSDRCLQEKFECYSFMWTCIWVLFMSGKNALKLQVNSVTENQLG